MKQNLLHIISNISSLLENKPEMAADLLLNAVRKFSTSINLEDEVVMLKWEYFNSDEKRKKEITERFGAILQELEKEYDEKSIENKQRKIDQLNEVYNVETDKKIIITAKNITKKYPRSSFSLNVDDLELAEGEIIGLVGENATGKSTLLNILAGELSKSSGEIQYPLFQNSKSINWIKVKPQIAYVPQHLPEWHGSLRENISFHAAIHGIKGEENDKAVERIIQLLGLGTHDSKSWKELSGGYKLRFALAKALVWKPKLLILDEPLAHLDVNAQITVLNDLRHLAKNKKNPLSVLVSSQHIHEIEFIADRILFMREGTIVSNKSTDEAINQQNHFELSCNLDSNDLKVILKDTPHFHLSDKEMHYVISVPPSFDSQQILSILLEKGIRINYFRDISQSIKTKFYERGNPK